jgi:glycosyltransferase involved in cell wall biosynthesis
MNTNDTNAPLISVVLCFYNEQDFLEEAVTSVIRQTHQSWELNLIDDGSSDRSTVIAKQFASQYPGKINYYHHPGHTNEGLSASRNVGIEKSRGEFIAFIDADDIWVEDKLEKQIQIFKNHPEATVILSASEYWRSWENSNAKDVVVYVGAEEKLYTPPMLSLRLYPLGKGSAPCPSGIMAHRSVFTRCWFEESYRGIYQMYEDQAFLGKVYVKETVFVSHDCNNRYRQRSTSLVSSVTASGKYHEVRKYYLKWFYYYLKTERIRFPEVMRKLQFARMPYLHPWKYALTVEYPSKVKSLGKRFYTRIKGLSLIRS